MHSGPWAKGESNEAGHQLFYSARMFVLESDGTSMLKGSLKIQNVKEYGENVFTMRRTGWSNSQDTKQRLDMERRVLDFLP